MVDQLFGKNKQNIGMCIDPLILGQNGFKI